MVAAVAQNTVWIQGQDPVHLLVTVDFLGSEAGFHLFRVFLDALDVQHGITS